ncbi:MAG TPA: hypothetical protein VGR07_09820 [Thermoanaerobaculia bacterium]|jgi:hypothetical protein|nr:hypothetical protein [Thermoanaerobaculia bacterium]
MTRTIHHRGLIAAVLGLGLGVGLSVGAFGQAPGSPDELTRAAQFVFRGTVQKTGAANLDAVKADAGTAVVRVDEVLKAPSSLGDFTGREITVKLQKAGAAVPGEQAVFFTNGWLYGATLAVVEVGRLHGSAALLRDQVAAAWQKADDATLQERLDRAELIVAGKVVETHPAPAASALEALGLDSEHDPEWWEAVVQVDSVLKGQPGGQRVVFLYPTSRDVHWYEAPKPGVGWDGIWLLYRNQVPELGLSGYTALKPWNLLSRDQLAGVRRLLGR